MAEPAQPTSYQHYNITSMSSVPARISTSSLLRDRSFFTREGGLVGFGKHHLKIA